MRVERARGANSPQHQWRRAQPGASQITLSPSIVGVMAVAPLVPTIIRRLSAGLMQFFFPLRFRVRVTADVCVLPEGLTIPAVGPYRQNC
jgi:hypothetical protein